MSKIEWAKKVTVAAKTEAAREGMKAKIKSQRDKAMRAGIEMQGMTLDTDDKSQARITGAALAAQIDPETEIRWKTPQGFVTLDAPTIIAIAQAVRSRVQDCFDREDELLADLAEADDPAALDPTTGWPGGAE